MEQYGTFKLPAMVLLPRVRNKIILHSFPDLLGLLWLLMETRGHDCKLMNVYQTKRKADSYVKYVMS